MNELSKVCYLGFVNLKSDNFSIMYTIKQSSFLFFHQQKIQILFFQQKFFITKFI